METKHYFTIYTKYCVFTSNRFKVVVYSDKFITKLCEIFIKRTPGENYCDIHPGMLIYELEKQYGITFTNNIKHYCRL